MQKAQFQKQYMSSMNRQQKVAVETVDGSVLLLAVPGSGKTTVLITRLGYMVNCCGIAPENILTMTYTVAATQEMKQRFMALFGEDIGRRMEFRTINGISSKIIAYYGSSPFSHRKPFEVQSNEGALSALIRQSYLQVHQEYPDDSSVKDIQTAIAYVKNMMLPEDQISDAAPRIEKFSEIYRLYNAQLQESHFMDYDDQLKYALAILQKFPDILAHFQDRFRYLCVDEAQDTSRIQHEIIRTLAGKQGNLFMVGDEDQSIYGFRAAYPEALMNFETTYPRAKVLLMEHNYRSTEQIIQAANVFVSRNHSRRDKHILPTQGSGRSIQIIQVQNRETQFQYLAALSGQLSEETAVLFRNNESALPLIDLLDRKGIPFNCRKFEDAFFSNRLVCDVTDILTLALHPDREESFLRIYYKLGAAISQTVAEYACERSRQTGRGLLEEAFRYPNLKKYTKDMLLRAMAAMRSIANASAFGALYYIWNDLNYRDFVRSHKMDDGKYYILVMLARQLASAEDFLLRLQELRDLIQEHQNRRENRLILSTIHSSKGLEYENVYLLDVFDGVFPTDASEEKDRDAQDERDYQEERRLFYVAMTRARKTLWMFQGSEPSAFLQEVQSSLPKAEPDPKDRFSSLRSGLLEKEFRDREKGSGQIVAQCPDFVLVEFGPQDRELLTLEQLYQRWDSDSREQALRPEKKSAFSSSGSLAASLIRLPSIGTVVLHERFGKGKVESAENDMLSVRFLKSGELRYFSFPSALQKGILRVLV